jgi:GTP-binding protein
VPRGGPDGGDGGQGGSVVMVANPNLNTLRKFARQVHFRAEHGGKGGRVNQTGRSAENLIIEVPVGTIVRTEDGQLIADLAHPGQEVVVAKGGRGGRGNYRFRSSTHQAPHIAEKGEPSEEKWLNLELKLVADVGIVGMPNAGKSTLLSVVSNAKPKIADYPFTTLVPNLGMVQVDYRDLVMADIPGLVEGAHQGIGLGHDFLRHIQRTRVLIHLLDGAGENPLADFHQINTELALFDVNLLERPTIVVVNKMDLPEAQAAWPKLKAELGALGYEPMAISAATQQGTRELIYQCFALLDTLPQSPFVADSASIISAQATPDEMPIYDLGEDEMAFTVEKTGDGVFIVKGKAIERAAAMTYWNYEDALMRFQRILEATGITDALEKQGVAVGDTVFIGNLELEWSE